MDGERGEEGEGGKTRKKETEERAGKPPTWAKPLTPQLIGHVLLVVEHVDNRT